ncbi:MAG TPA: alpha/beta fold hydrolase [Mycobacteriales bacterium]|nr:alpha/beta fold hydrolase [Mycobacteriales bacterium]
MNSTQLLSGRRGMTGVAAITALVLALAVPGVAAASANGHPSYPVPYSFLPDMAAAPSNAPPPGANHWSCKPTDAHPYPVILVHGLLSNQADNWQTYGPLLADNGYCVFTLTYGTRSSSPPFSFMGGLTPMPGDAKVLGRFVDKVLAATHAHKVDIVGHSEGATMPYWYLKFDGGAAKVAHMVGLSPVVHGSWVSGVPLIDSWLTALGLPHAMESVLGGACAACAEINPDSAWIAKLDRGGVAVPGVIYTQVMTEYDELVVPYTSGNVDGPNSTNIVIQHQCPADTVDHVSMGVDPNVAQDVLNALDPSRHKPVVCSPFVPVVGQL